MNSRPQQTQQGVRWEHLQRLDAARRTSVLSHRRVSVTRDRTQKHAMHRATAARPAAAATPACSGHTSTRSPCLLSVCHSICHTHALLRMKSIAFSPRVSYRGTHCMLQAQDTNNSNRVTDVPPCTVCTSTCMAAVLVACCLWRPGSTLSPKLPQLSEISSQADYPHHQDHS